MDTTGGSVLSSPAWVATPAARTSRRTGPGEGVAAAMLGLGWILLWSFFLVGVAEPAAALRVAAAREAAAPAAASPEEARQRPVPPPLVVRVRP